MTEPNRGACIRGAGVLVEKAVQFLHAAGHLLKSAGLREEEVGVLVANAFLHARRARQQCAELSTLFPDREKPSPLPSEPPAPIERRAS